MDFGTILLTSLAALNLLILAALYFRRRVDIDPEVLRPQFENISNEARRIEQALRDECARQRDESGRSGTSLREEVGSRLSAGLETLLKRQAESHDATERKLEAVRAGVENRLQTFGEASDSRLARLRQELNDSATQTRGETRQGFGEFKQSVSESLAEARNLQGNQLNEFSQRLDKINDSLSQHLDRIRQTVEGKLNELQTKNEQKLEEMRKTVDEKLEGTLERRLGESFKLVSERLEAVHKGLGEMQVIASSVGDLKRVLTNVKTRGTWGEIQLGSLLEQILTPDQYAANVAPKPNSAERVEFAIRLPGSGKNGTGRGDDQPVWLPIDAKFPQEDYQRLIEATESGDAEGVAQAGKALETRIRAQARDIRDKYICPPYTTDFALLFLPSEGLYAEVLRRPGLGDSLQRDFRVTIAGPTTLAAILNSLQMGFRTLAIQERSSEVWKVLAAVKTEFGKFGDVLSSVKTKLEQASKQIDQTEVRTRAINRTLRVVEAMPADATARVLSESSENDEDAPAPARLAAKLPDGDFLTGLDPVGK